MDIYDYTTEYMDILKTFFLPTMRSVCTYMNQYGYGEQLHHYTPEAMWHPSLVQQQQGECWSNGGGTYILAMTYDDVGEWQTCRSIAVCLSSDACIMSPERAR